MPNVFIAGTRYGTVLPYNAFGAREAVLVGEVKTLSRNVMSEISKVQLKILEALTTTEMFNNEGGARGEVEESELNRNLIKFAVSRMALTLWMKRATKPRTRSRTSMVIPLTS
jgi:hypothetical protein